MTPRLSAVGVAFGALFRDVDLALEAGRTIALLGPSGVGKTTLLHLLAGELAPDAGRIDRAGRLGVVFQEDALWAHLSARAHLEVVGATRAEAAALLARADLAALADRRPSSLSGGERRRLALARALAARPAWLLLDEPTAQLDGPARERMLALLRDGIGSTGAGVLLATHHAEEALAFADEIVVLRPGGIAARGAPEALWRDPGSIEVARMLGPAGLLDGAIVRPGEVRFDPDPAGEDVVVACAFVGPAWRLAVRRGAEVVPVAAAQPCPVGAQGRLRRRAAEEAP